MNLDHLEFDVMCIYGRRNVCWSECYVVSDERDKPTPDLCGLSAQTVVYVGTLGVFDLEVSLVS